MGIKKPEKQPKHEQHSRHLERNFSGLCEALKDASSVVRRRAVTDLAEFPEATAILGDLLQSEKQQAVQEAAILSLFTIANENAIDVLVDCLRSEDVFIRNEAISALRGLPTQMSRIIKDLITDTDPDVRIFSINVLESLSHPDVEDWLIDVLNNESDLNVCAATVDVMVGVATKKSVPAILSIQQRFPDEPYIIFASNLALSRLSEE